MARNLATTNTARYTVICKSYDAHSRPSRAAAVLAAPDITLSWYFACVFMSTHTPTALRSFRSRKHATDPQCWSFLSSRKQHGHAKPRLIDPPMTGTSPMTVLEPCFSGLTRARNARRKEPTALRSPCCAWAAGRTGSALGHATAQSLKQPTSASHQGQVVGHEVEVGASALRNQAGWEGG